MKIKQAFLKEILQKLYGDEFQIIFDDSLVIQYLDKKTDAVNRDCSARRNLANLYAIYSMTHYYVLSEFESRDAYERFEGYPYSELKTFANDLYGGAKLQNHGQTHRRRADNPLPTGTRFIGSFLWLRKPLALPVEVPRKRALASSIERSELRIASLFLLPCRSR